jgi:hypothetical protein
VEDCPGVIFGTVVVELEEVMSVWLPKVFAPWTARAIQLKGMSTGAGLLRSIVKPALLF